MKGATFLVAAVAALALASPAGAATIEVEGRQKAIDESTAKMTGDLRGVWTTTSFEPVAFEPYFEAKGTELFEGCIDRRRDRSCKGDPSGTLTLEFRYAGALRIGRPRLARVGHLLASRRERHRRLRGRTGRPRVRRLPDPPGRQHPLHRQPDAEARRLCAEGVGDRRPAAGLLSGACSDGRSR